MRDEDEKSATIDPPSSEEEAALHLKTSAEENYNSGDLISAVECANRAHKLCPSITGLPELLTNFKILTAASAFESSSAAEKAIPDYYGILQVERFSHINLIKKQYKRLALTLHPDKNPHVASEAAFKLVGEAARVLSDSNRRREYDMKLRVAMQLKAAQEAELGASETFSAACSSCELLHQFEKKYLGHNLMCTGCKNTFKAMEVAEDRNKEGDEGIPEKNEGVGGGQTRVSARIREKVAKGGHMGIVERLGLGVKRKNSSVGEVLEGRVEKARKSGDGDGGDSSSKDEGAVDELRSKKVGRASKNGGGQVVENERIKRVEDSEEESMTLFQMKMLMKKKKRTRKEAEVDEVGIGKEKENVRGEEREQEIEREDGEKEKEKVYLRVKRNTNRRGVSKNKKLEDVNDLHSEIVKAKENVREEEREQEVEREDGAKEKVNLRPKRNTNRRGVSKEKKLEDVNDLHSEIVKCKSSKEGNLEDGKEKEKEIENTRGKRERRRTSKYGYSETNTSTIHVDSEIESLISDEKGSLEIMPLKDTDFHDFGKDRKEKSFKKGQVWAVYDDDDGMPRHYGLIDRVVSLNPFKVILIWLRFKSNKDEELLSWPNTGFHVSCGIFQLSRKVTINYLNIFSHLVDCERAAKELYRIYPKKGSVWAMHKSNNALQAEEINRGDKDKDTRCYDIVVCLTSYSDIHGLSVGYLEKVPEFKMVYKRREVGAKAVIYLGPKDVRKLSHEIPAKKLSGKESSNLQKGCWELDPASLTPRLIIAS